MKRRPLIQILVQSTLQQFPWSMGASQFLQMSFAGEHLAPFPSHSGAW